MLIAGLLGAAALAQAEAPACPIIIAENFSGLHFERGSAHLSRPDRLVLDNWVTIAAGRTYPTRFQLIGQTDRVGSRAANQRLSYRRADAVRRYLVRRGISADLISLTADGEDHGLAETKDGVAEPINRVVQLLALADEREQENHRICPPAQAPGH